MTRLRTLPGDDVRQIMWRFSDRYDLQMVAQSAKMVARGVVARLVANGARNSHEWTEEKAALLSAFDEAGLTSLFMDPEYGGFIQGPKNMALALAAFELSWVDGGAATCSLAGNLALSPIHERGTDAQKEYYMSRCIPAQPGDEREVLRGAFALTEPIPYVGVDTGVLAGKVSVEEWEEGSEPVLRVDKRGRFITNMNFANFVTAAVDSNDPRIKGSCMVILEETDPGVFDRGAPTLKMVHQLSSTTDPIFNMTIPANRIIGGYQIVDGVIVPNFNHSEVIGAVFRRTRVTVGLMSTAKLLSSIEPIIRYHRNRFRGGENLSTSSPRYELGLQQKEDASHRLIDIWAMGEAGASLGFATARLFDEFDLIERGKDAFFQAEGIKGARQEMRAMRQPTKDALEYLALMDKQDEPSMKRMSELESDTLVKYVLSDAIANVLCPACKLWNTGQGANMMREAVSLMGGYGITEDCPGFLGQKWMDTQLEATYEGPEAVQRRQLTTTMTNPVFMAYFERWIAEMKQIAAEKSEMGASTLAAAMELWQWTLNYLIKAKDANGKKLFKGQRQGVTFAMADALCWILASRHQILDTIELSEKGPQNPVLAEAIDGMVGFFADLCQVEAASAAGETGKICAELFYGYINLSSDDSQANDPEAFFKLRNKLDRCMAGARLAKDRAAKDLTQVMIPEALDYPM
ncbi:MAG: acyl-CoA dehydrogenase [Acidobacteria bacterium]|nr:MAG: acyl-CoA dehydrogenase [Acidobacteriota bacterium]